MSLKLLIASAAIFATAAGAATAATHNRNAAKGGIYAEPSQPIAYAKLDAYLKASPAQRAAGDWGLDTATAAAAPTGAGANVSAVAPDTTGATGQPPAAAMPATQSAPDTAPDTAPSSQSAPDVQSAPSSQSTPGADQSTTSPPPANNGSEPQ